MAMLVYRRVIITSPKKFGFSFISENHADNDLARGVFDEYFMQQFAVLVL